MPGSYGREESVGLSGSLHSLSLAFFEKVGSRFGSAGVFSLVAQGPLGLWRPWVPCWGSTGSHCFFPRFLTPALEFAFLGAVCGADVEGSIVEGLAGGSCLSHLWQAAGSVQSPASLPHIHHIEGIYQVSFPLSGEVFPSDTTCYA
jgi:hypothetical protein